MENIEKDLARVIDFGKYSGKTIDEISDIQPGYIVWLYENVKSANIPEWLYDACRMDVMAEDEALADAMMSIGDRDF